MGKSPTSAQFKKDLFWALFMPLVVGKSMVYYFGLNYSNYPGEGYGWGLLFSVLFTLFNLGRFIWKYRHYNDEN